MPFSIYTGFIHFKNKETNEISVMPTDISDSPVLVASFINQHIKESERIAMNYSIQQEFIDEKYLQAFKKTSENPIIKNNKIPVSFEVEDNYFFLRPLYFLENYETKNEEEIIADYQKDFEGEVFPEESMPEFVFFKSLFLEKDNEQKIVNFESSDDFRFYENEINDAIEFSLTEEKINEISSLSDEEILLEYIDEDNEEIENYEIDSESNIEMNEFFIKNNVGEKWNKQIELLKKLYEREDLFLTILSHYSGDFATFGEDNKHFILNFINDEIKYALISEELENLNFSLVIRQSTKIFHNNKTPEKRVAMCILNQDGIHPISKKDALKSSLVHPETGEKLKKEKGVHYVSFEEMMRTLNFIL